MENMLNTDFDPYQALINLDHNMKNLVQAHNQLAERVQQQEQVIDTLIKGLEMANKANERLIRDNFQQLYKTVTATGEH